MRGVYSVPKRFSELIALISVSTTVFLFIHTQMLTAKIEEIEGMLTALAGASSPSSHHQMKKAEEEIKRVEKRGQSEPKGMISFTLPSRLYNATELNNTRRSSKETLFFNRVPKVGSQTIMDLIIRLSAKNEFHFHKDATQKVETIKLSFYEQSRLATLIDMFSSPSAYAKHVCFTNLTRHGYSMPIYMNFVRDPIERVISWFYYIRAPWYIIERKQAFPDLPLPNAQWLKKDFETCVLEGHRECQFIPGEYHDGVGDHRRQAMFFCGHDERCVEFNGEWAMQQAKKNVEKYYAVVGVLEELQISLRVMEEYIPKFFRGASSIYKDNMSVMGVINKNIYKPPVKNHVKKLLRQNFTREIEFYEFCKQRLHLQYAAIYKPMPDE